MTRFFLGLHGVRVQNVGKRGANAFDLYASMTKVLMQNQDTFEFSKIFVENNITGQIHMQFIVDNFAKEHKSPFKAIKKPYKAIPDQDTQGHANSNEATHQCTSLFG